MSNELPWALNLARKHFKKLPSKKKKVVACFMDGGTIIMASNQKKTNPHAARLNYRNCHMHAEFSVLRQVRDAKNGTLYVYRENQGGVISLARPCNECMVYIREKGVRKIVYSTNQGWAKERIIYD